MNLYYYHYIIEINLNYFFPPLSSKYLSNSKSECTICLSFSSRTPFSTQPFCSISLRASAFVFLIYTLWIRLIKLVRSLNFISLLVVEEKWDSKSLRDIYFNDSEVSLIVKNESEVLFAYFKPSSPWIRHVNSVAKTYCACRLSGNLLC